MIRKFTTDEIEQLKSEIYSLKENVINCTSTKIPIDEQKLKNEYNFLYKNSKDLFQMIIKDYGSQRHVSKIIHDKFDKLIEVLIQSLKDLKNDVTHYQVSKNYERSFRNELWPENLRKKFEDE